MKNKHGYWAVTLHGRVTGNPYIYRVELPYNSDLKDVINHAASMHVDATMYDFEATSEDGSEFTSKTRFGLEWMDIDDSA